MSAAALTGRAPPLVAVICSVPMVFEGLREALEPIASVLVFPVDDGLVGLLRSVAPDVVIVDTEEEARKAEPIARELGITVVHLGLRQRYVRVFHDGGWQAANQDGITPEAVRNIVAGHLFGRREAT